MPDPNFTIYSRKVLNITGSKNHIIPSVNSSIASVFVGDTGCWCILSVFQHRWLVTMVVGGSRCGIRDTPWGLFSDPQPRDLYHKFLLLKGVPNTKNSCKVRGVNRTDSRNIGKVGLFCKFEQFRFQHQRCSSSHNSLRGIHPSTHPLHPTF